jgi:uncharacterized iron-regulated membrane protein
VNHVAGVVEGRLFGVAGVIGAMVTLAAVRLLALAAFLVLRKRKRTAGAGALAPVEKEESLSSGVVPERV